jgi:hypothetical protein
VIDENILLPAQRRGSGTEPTAEAFDWHAGKITRSTPVTRTYRNTQNVRRFLRAQCGGDFKFDRPFMQWIKGGSANTMGDVADEWLRRRDASRR